MDLQHTYTVAEVLEMAMTLNDEDREKVKVEIEKSLIEPKEVLDRMAPYHKKFQATYRALA